MLCAGAIGDGWRIRARHGLVWACIVAGHALLVLLTTVGDRMPVLRARDVQERLQVVLLPPRMPDPAAPSPAPPRVVRSVPPDRTHDRAPDAIAPAPESSAIHAPTPGRAFDWDGARERAARAATEPPPRGFGMPASTPAPKPAREFGWDKTHTERVRQIPNGGIAVRLNDNCELVLMPLPIGGCALGKRPARGDLFDGLGDADRPRSSVPDAPR